MTDKPPEWNCHTKRAARAMTDWVNRELFLEDMTEMRKALRGEVEREADAEDLRRKYPELKEFYLRKRREPDVVGRAVADVRRIRALWLRTYGKKQRSRFDRISAEQIAADRYDLDVEILIARMRKT